MSFLSFVFLLSPIVTLSVYFLLRKHIFFKSVQSYKDKLLICQNIIKKELEDLLINIKLYNDDFEINNKNYYILKNQLVNLNNMIELNVKNLNNYSLELNKVVSEIKLMEKDNDLTDLKPVIKFSYNEEWKNDLNKLLLSLNDCSNKYMTYKFDEDETEITRYSTHMIDWYKEEEERLNDYQKDNKYLFSINSEYQKEHIKMIEELENSTNQILLKWFTI